MSKLKVPLVSKIVSPESLRSILVSQVQEGKKVVFTNGCFDLLHKGHVTYLEKASELGDILVVALNSDDSISKIKGPHRPLIPLADRLEVVAALGSVDWVTWFDEQTPETLIQFLKPQILVKGGDWAVSQIIGSEDVLARGGKVYSLPYVPGHSTTDLIARARKMSK